MPIKINLKYINLTICSGLEELTNLGNGIGTSFYT